MDYDATTNRFSGGGIASPLCLDPPPTSCPTATTPSTRPGVADLVQRTRRRQMLWNRRESGPRKKPLGLYDRHERGTVDDAKAVCRLPSSRSSRSRPTSSYTVGHQDPERTPTAIVKKQLQRTLPDKIAELVRLSVAGTDQPRAVLQRSDRAWRPVGASPGLLPPLNLPNPRGGTPKHDPDDPIARAGLAPPPNLVRGALRAGGTQLHVGRRRPAELRHRFLVPGCFDETKSETPPGLVGPRRPTVRLLTRARDRALQHVRHAILGATDPFRRIIVAGAPGPPICTSVARVDPARPVHADDR